VVSDVHAGDGMQIRTGDDYRSSLRDGRVIYFDGQLVEDVTVHPRFQSAVEVTARGYDQGLDLSGRSSFPATEMELREQVETFTNVQAQIDLLGATTFSALLGIETAADRLADDLPEYAQRINNFVAWSRRHNRRCVPTITDAKGDRSTGPMKQSDPDQYVRVVGSDENGIVIRGAKLHIRGAAILHDLLVLPTKKMSPGEEEWAVACAVPVSTPGVEILNAGWHVPPQRDSYYPYSRNRTIPVGLVVFNDVYVPMERVFLLGEIQHSATLVHAFGTWDRIISASMMAADAHMYVGLAQLLAEANGVDRTWHVRDKITEIVLHATMIRAGVEAAIANAELTSSGYLAPAELYTNAAKHYASINLTRVMTLVQDLAGGSIVNAPMPGDLEGAHVGELVKKYMQGPDGISGEYRTRLMYAARDVVADWFAGHTQVLGLHGAGGPYAQRLVARKNYPVSDAKSVARAALGLSEDTAI
jgi:4-hydroxybutyryl-CoA dehydratase/vinylacetyl-CoA-Delta-isomerase